MNNNFSSFALIFTNYWFFLSTNALIRTKPLPRNAFTKLSSIDSVPIIAAKRTSAYQRIDIFNNQRKLDDARNRVTSLNKAKVNEYRVEQKIRSFESEELFFFSSPSASCTAEWTPNEARGEQETRTGRRGQCTTTRRSCRNRHGKSKLGFGTFEICRLLGRINRTVEAWSLTRLSPSFPTSLSLSLCRYRNPSPRLSPDDW